MFFSISQDFVRHTFVLAGLVLIPASGVPQNASTTEPVDPRLVKLRGFLLERESPISHLAEDFILAADQNGLDWRLLPSIAMVESSGAKYYINNNIFGWDNGKIRFRSVHSSIYEVALSISSMRCYRGKDLDAMLWTYNPIEGYNARIKKAIRALDPDYRPSRSVMMKAGGTIFPPRVLVN
jgi:hypothetical protein